MDGTTSDPPLSSFGYSVRGCLPSSSEGEEAGDGLRGTAAQISVLFWLEKIPGIMACFS